MIEIVDFTPFDDSLDAALSGKPSPAQRKVASQINRCFREEGFLFLKSFGMSLKLLHELYTVSKELFGKSEEFKCTKLKPVDVTSNIGYVRKGGEVLSKTRGGDLKEAYNFKHSRVSGHDFDGCPARFKSLAEDFWDSLSDSARRLAIACAIGLDLPPDFFSSKLQHNEHTTFRMIHYPPCVFKDGESTGGNAYSSLRVGEHVDFGLFTFLFTDGPGLQVKGVAGACVDSVTTGWRDVPEVDFGTAIVNTGSLMARWTNDYWCATAHRVVVRRGMEKSRYSIACFYEPDEGSIVSVHDRFVGEDGKKYEDISSWDFLQMKLRQAHEGKH